MVKKTADLTMYENHVTTGNKIKNAVKLKNKVDYGLHKPSQVKKLDSRQVLKLQKFKFKLLHIKVGLRALEISGN